MFGFGGWHGAMGATANGSGVSITAVSPSKLASAVNSRVETG